MAFQETVEYRYFLTDLLSNNIISEIPFRGVSFGRANRRAGEFSGTIAFVEATKGLDLYEATMPGRTGVYIVRNNVCVWGGIIWERTYSVSEQTLEVSGSEFLSYLYHRNIWQTIQYGSDYLGVAAYQTFNGVATITTEFPHGFRSGDKVSIGFTNPTVDGIQTITNVTSSVTFEFDTQSADSSGFSTSGAVRSLVDNFDLARNIVYQISTDLGGLAFANEVIKPAKEYQASVISKERSSNVVTLRTSEDHEAIPGQEIEVVEVGSGLDGIHTIVEVPNARTIRYELIGPDVTKQNLSGIRSINVLSKQLLNNVATLTLDQPHNASVGQTVIVEGVDAFFTGRLDTTFNGRFTITGTPTANSFTFSSGGILNVGPESVAGGQATFGSKFIYGDYGSFTSNSDVGIEFENFDQLGSYGDIQTYRGFELRTAGEILEEFSNSVSGAFEYRIDCDYNYDTSTFSRTFRLFPVELPNTPENEELYTAKELGADLNVFEYPGNIIDFTVTESAEESATRFFVVGSIADMTDSASQPYAGATAKDMLESSTGRSWPLLDQSEQLDGIEDEFTLYDYAQDYLYESRPPIGTFEVTVNGTISPTVGSYFPGDWCTLIIDDEFVRQRLVSDQEPRSDILIRKINSYTVEVPDNPAFPETVTLELVTDWMVDQSG